MNGYGPAAPKHLHTPLSSMWKALVILGLGLLLVLLAILIAVVTHRWEKNRVLVVYVIGSVGLYIVMSVIVYLLIKFCQRRETDPSIVLQRHRATTNAIEMAPLPVAPPYYSCDASPRPLPTRPLNIPPPPYSPDNHNCSPKYFTTDDLPPRY